MIPPQVDKYSRKSVYASKNQCHYPETILSPFIEMPSSMQFLHVSETTLNPVNIDAASCRFLQTPSSSDICE